MVHTDSMTAQMRTEPPPDCYRGKANREREEMQNDKLRNRVEREKKRERDEHVGGEGRGELTRVVIGEHVGLMQLDAQR